LIWTIPAKGHACSIFPLFLLFCPASAPMCTPYLGEMLLTTFFVDAVCVGLRYLSKASGLYGLVHPILWTSRGIGWLLDATDGTTCSGTLWTSHIITPSIAVHWQATRPGLWLWGIDPPRYSDICSVADKAEQTAGRSNVKPHVDGTT